MHHYVIMSSLLQEDRCLIVIGDETDAFRLGQCYSTKYNGGRYEDGCYREGEHCWDNACHNGTLCVCLGESIS